MQYKVIHSLALALTSAASVNIHSTDAQTIALAIKGVGQKKAEAIVSYWKTNGPFSSIDDLASSKDIGLKTVDKNHKNLSVSN